VLTSDPVYHARGAALTAGYPESVPVQCINRFCSSGLMATTTIANQIRTGQIDIGLAVGIESMSEKCVNVIVLFLIPVLIMTFSPDKGGPTQTAEIANNYPAKDCPKPMGWTSENVAIDFDVTREEMDDFAAQSYTKAEHAQKAGYFDREIVPFTAYKKNSLGVREKVTISKDDGIRYGTVKESLSKIRAAFPQWGNASTTGGNASQITDGAAAVLLMSRRKAQELGLTILAKFVTTAVTGNTFSLLHG
jgi:acetyl-CoA acyltransferase 1